MARQPNHSYAYVRQFYGVDPRVGQRVTHHVTKKSGVVRAEDKSQAHYVQVLFDGYKHAMPCHPRELNYH